ncbi:MAG: cytochrome b N-terminal domain-containing protein [bacterium]
MKNNNEQKKSYLETHGLKELIRTISFTAIGSVVYGGLDRRLELKDALNEALKHPVPKFVNWTYCFGGMTFFLFVVQAVTGILLTMYYQPSPETAHESIKFIMNEAPFGWHIRSIHHWGAQLMMVTIFLHMLRVYFTGAYKHPRELNWIAGVFLFVITITFGFTGYLLTWDQRAFWGTTVGTHIVGDVPLIGNYLLYVLRGGDEVSGLTLTRFFSFHVIILPMLVSVFLIAHFAMIRRQGISEPL